MNYIGTSSPRYEMEFLMKFDDVRNFLNMEKSKIINLTYIRVWPKLNAPEQVWVQ